MNAEAETRSRRSARTSTAFHPRRMQISSMQFRCRTVTGDAPCVGVLAAGGGGGEADDGVAVDPPRGVEANDEDVAAPPAA